MFFNNPTPTDAGRALIIKALAGETITFSKLGLGNGVVPADVTPLTELVNPCVKFGLTSITTGVGGVSLSGSFDNSSIEEDFVATELGIYAIDPDDGEILYALARPYGEPTTIPAGANSGYGRINLNVVVAVGDAENVTAIISEFIGYATITAFNAHVDNTDNPHQVTKAQVGLGKVPNVSTNNQTPTFTEAERVTEIESGSTLRVLLGQIKRAIRELINHVTADNPHNITPAGILAAKAIHTHLATDITSGTMKVARGGTGKSTWSPSRLLYASSASALSQVELPTDSDDMVLNQTTAGALSWVYPKASEHGQYIGNNQAGSSHPTTITSKRTPSLIIVRSSKAASLSSFSYGVIFPWAHVGFSVYNPGGSTGGIYVELKVSTSGSGYARNVSWYDTEARPAHQLCTTGEKYFYTLIY